MDDRLLNGVLLLRKLSFHRVDSITAKWFRSYRKQKTDVNGSLSDDGSTVCGVPQVSILGPLLFLIYINDLPVSGLFSKPRLYADDTCLNLTSHDPTGLQIKLNNVLNKIQS